MFGFCDYIISPSEYALHQHTAILHKVIQNGSFLKGQRRTINIVLSALKKYCFKRFTFRMLYNWSRKENPHNIFLIIAQ